MQFKSTKDKGKIYVNSAIKLVFILFNIRKYEEYNKMHELNLLSFNKESVTTASILL